ncbi:hypothetical protein [Tindallia californiensis]|uniref:Uncharacterized protein n=1 Tax=Tindallia californiensis TaxID=159292 RepID=A0A1H3QQ59_9FIRM|nr:hypothetical protein [Tindallia californiensis]SDZ15135.1 hypothetical protein SAMN05192546_11027 [Tindallia californiensis]
MTIHSPLLIQLMMVVIPLYALGMLLPEFTRRLLFAGIRLPIGTGAFTLFLLPPGW